MRHDQDTPIPRNTGQQPTADHHPAQVCKQTKPCQRQDPFSSPFGRLRTPRLRSTNVTFNERDLIR